MADERLSEIMQILSEMWRIVRELKARVDAMERCLGRDGFNVILDETHVPEKHGLLGGKTLLSTGSGGVKRIIRHAFCDQCGSMLVSGNISVCTECGRKLCQRCAARYNNRTFCVECLQHLLRLNKKDFKVLLSIANNHVSIAQISECTGMVKKDIIASVSKLRSLRLIYRRGISVFSRIFVTDDGLSVLGAYMQIYREDRDIVELLKKFALKAVDYDGQQGNH